MLFLGENNTRTFVLIFISDFENEGKEMKNAFKSGGEQLLKLSQSDLYKHIICPNLQSFILNSSGDPKVSKYSKSVSLILS